jgi:hypothetical protein
VLAPLQRELLLCLAAVALQSQNDLLGSLCLLVEHGLGLTRLLLVNIIPLESIQCEHTLRIRIVCGRNAW